MIFRAMRSTPKAEKICVVSLGINKHKQENKDNKLILSNFSESLEYLSESLRESGFSGEIITWDDEYPAGSPKHEDSPMGFKPFCMLEAKRRGYSKVFWIDSSFRINNSFDSLVARLNRLGYVMFYAPHNLGQYCKDDALKTLGISREQSFRMPSLSSSFIGLDLNREICLKFLNRWSELAVDGVTFSGPKWSGIKGWPKTASLHPDVKGHRHDQTAASVIALKLQMWHWLPYKDMKTYGQNDRAFARTYRE